MTEREISGATEVTGKIQSTHRNIEEIDFFINSYGRV